MEKSDNPLHKNLVFRGSGSDLATDINAALNEVEIRRLRAGLRLPKIPDNDDGEVEEELWIRGERAALVGMLRHILSSLGYEGSEAESSKWILEREAAVAKLRSVCAGHGDNDWENNLSLADVIDKHLYNYLEN